MGELIAIRKYKSKTVAYGLWISDPSHPDTPMQRDRTLSWLRFGYQGPVIESHSVESILDQALAAAADACFIQTPGNIISEDWMLPHWGQADFHANLIQWVENNNDYLVCAEVRNIDEYVCLNAGCFLVNLHHYRALGKPEFGVADAQSCTPVELQPAVPKRNGWGFIDASLKHGMAIPGLPEQLSTKQIFLAAPDASHELPENDNDQQRQRFLKGVDTQVSCGRRGVFLWNIESYGDIPSADAANRTNEERITRLYCVAAGFKPNMLLHRHGYTPDTEITFFDYSQRALEIRKVLLSEWDGTDYPGFCRQLMQRFPAGETFYQLWNGLKPSQINWQDVERLWESELTHWGGAQSFRKEWQAQCALKYEFIHCDIVNAPASLLEKIPGVSGTTLWWSNAFFTITSNWLLSIEERRQRFRQWVEGIAERSPQCRLYGADHNNTPVNNINAAEYLSLLKTGVAGSTPDELKPNRFTARTLRF